MIDDKVSDGRHELLRQKGLKHLLIVEDSKIFQKLLQRSLAPHRMTFVETVDEGMRVLRNTQIDLILLDITLPGRDGYSMLGELQSLPEFENIPVICLTGKTEVSDKITAFTLGADDYIVKPFEPLELRARVEGRLAKVARKRETLSVTRIGDLEVDLTAHRASVVTDGEKSTLSLTQTEFKLLCCLVRRPDQVFTRDQLLVAAWGEDANVLDRVIDVHVSALRRKLGRLGDSIEAVPGLGYRYARHPMPKPARVKRKTAA